MIFGLILIFIILLIAFHNKGIPVFLYHHVNETSSMPEELFEEHLKIIKKNSMNTITVTDLLNKNIPSKSILITLDDGYKDNYTNVFRLLKKYNMKATIFLNTEYMDNDDEYLTWENIKEMSESGIIDFQCHSHGHKSIIVEDKVIDISDGKPIFRIRGEYSSKAIIIKDEFYDVFYKYYNEDLKKRKLTEQLKLAQNFISSNKDKYFYYENNEEYNKRITEDFLLNKEAIESHLMKKVTFFCWPWGHRSKEAIKILEKFEIKGFVSTKKGTNSYESDLHMIKRIELREFTAKKFTINLFVGRNLILGKIYSLLS
ncbi:MAG: polysaccharide deacetylase family protein [Fusobacteriaceae bacterium]|jgi:peptidoglycan/xylan/chitin deacetylase (PgdA/CDA1 family)|nr:polysaccharide deacetylase family protein [Fusobacteriaceae bacterium]